MREIKFRAWVKNEFMLEWSDILRAEPALPMNLVNDKDYNWMQYIGFKDKNDVEIYERDIVKYYYGDGKNDWLIREIYSGNELGNVLIKKCVGKEVIYFTELWKSEDIEVMGNIYENKDLLNN